MMQPKSIMTSVGVLSLVIAATVIFQSSVYLEDSQVPSNNGKVPLRRSLKQRDYIELPNSTPQTVIQSLMQHAIPMKEYRRRLDEEEEEEDEDEDDYQGDDGDDYYMDDAVMKDFSGYAFKYAKCQPIQRFSDTAVSKGSYSAVVTDDMVVFRLCPERRCSASAEYGCTAGYGEYAIELRQYLKIMLYYQTDRETNFCSFCSTCGYRRRQRTQRVLDEDNANQNEDANAEEANDADEDAADEEQNADEQQANEYNEEEADNQNDGEEEEEYEQDADEEQEEEEEYEQDAYEEEEEEYEQDADEEQEQNEYNEEEAEEEEEADEEEAAEQNAAEENVDDEGEDEQANSGYNAAQYDDDGNDDSEEEQNQQENSYNAANGDDYYAANGDDYYAAAANDDYYEANANETEYSSYSQQADDYYAADDDYYGDDADDGYNASSYCSTYADQCSDVCSSGDDDETLSYLDYIDYFYCVKVESRNTFYYIKPICDSGSQIIMGAFYDKFCTRYAGKDVNVNKITGISFSKDLFSTFSSGECLNCDADENAPYYNSNNLLCNSLFNHSAQCNTYFAYTLDDDDNDDDSSSAVESSDDVCTYLENIRYGSYNGQGEITSSGSLKGEATSFQVVALVVLAIICSLLAIQACFLHHQITNFLLWQLTMKGSLIPSTMKVQAKRKVVERMSSDYSEFS